MANTITSQILSDGERNAVVRISIVGDSSGDEASTTLVNASDFSGSFGDLKITGIWAQLDGFSAKLEWNANTNVDILNIPANLEIDQKFGDFGGLINSSGAGKNGDIDITTTDLDTEEGTIILWMKKHRTAVADNTLTLSYNYLLDSGSTISQSVVEGPVPTFTRASDAGSFTSDGTWALVGGNNLPRYVHDPANSNARLGMLMESARTNLCLQSSTFGTTWSVGALNVDIPTTNNSDIFGTTTADEIATTNTADEAYAIFQDLAGLTANVVTSCAVYVKTGTNVTFVQLAWDDTGGGADGLFCNFQLTGAGTAGTVTALAAGGDTKRASIELTADGFYRCAIAGEIDIGTAGRFTISMVDRIDAGVFEAADLADNDSIIVCAADVQVGQFITSHIPTTTVSVTRAKDRCEDRDASWFNSQAGTWIIGINFSFITPVTKTLFRMEKDAGDQPSHRIQFDSNNTEFDYRLQQVSGTDVNISGSQTHNAAGNVKVGYAYALNDMQTYSKGATDGSVSTLTPLESGHDELIVGGESAANSELGGFMQTFKFYNVRKPNAFLATETT